MNIQIKQLNELEVTEMYELFKLRNEVFVVEQKCIYQDCDDKDHRAYHLLCKEQGNIVAYLRILEKGVSYDEISIGRVLVDLKYRGKGLAREILWKAIDFIDKHLNEKIIRISAQEYLVDLYRSLGFEIDSEMYLEDEIPHIEMIYNNK